MTYYDRQDIIEVVERIKNLQKEITEQKEYVDWYNDVMTIDNLQPCKMTYDICKKNLPEQRIKMVELENELERIMEEMI